MTVSQGATARSRCALFRLSILPSSIPSDAPDQPFFRSAAQVSLPDSAQKERPSFWDGRSERVQIANRSWRYRIVLGLELAQFRIIFHQDYVFSSLCGFALSDVMPRPIAGVEALGLARSSLRSVQSGAD